MDFLLQPVSSALAALPKPAALPSAVFERWAPGATPLSTAPPVVAVLALYLVVIFTGQHLMKDRKPMSQSHPRFLQVLPMSAPPEPSCPADRTPPLPSIPTPLSDNPTEMRSLFIVHNALLSTGSGLLLAAMLEQVVPMVYRHGLFFALCNARAWTPRLEACYLINYYFKYWELADTMFLVAKKKPLKFLHVFHHANTALLCFVQLHGRASVSWVPISANLAVHVAMYYYYLMTAAGRKVWWKRYLTSLQIAQFVADLVVVNFAYVHLFGSRYAPVALPFCRECSGGEGAALFGCATGVAYLVLFIRFQRETYGKAKGRGTHLGKPGPPPAATGFLQNERPAPISAASDAELARHLVGES